MPFSAQHLKAARLHLMESSANMKQIIKAVGPFRGRMTPDERSRGLESIEDSSAIQQLEDSGVPRIDAERLLFYSLGRLDVLPASDPAFIQSAKESFQLPDSLQAPEWHQLFASWQPYRSIAGWYLIQAFTLKKQIGN